MLLQLYEEAVNDQPYSFLFIKMKAPKEKMVSIRFDEILQVEGKDEIEDGELPVTNNRQATGRQ